MLSFPSTFSSNSSIKFASIPATTLLPPTSLTTWTWMLSHSIIPVHAKKSKLLNNFFDLMGMSSKDFPFSTSQLLILA
jgi:hypothetical protein